MNTINNMSMADLYQRTLDKEKYVVENGYEYVSKWECEFDEELKTNETMKTFDNRGQFEHGRTVTTQRCVLRRSNRSVYHV